MSQYEICISNCQHKSIVLRIYFLKHMYVFDKLTTLLGIIPSYIGNILQYDDDGNLISSVNGENSETYTYNSKNNLTSCGKTEYTYDAEGNRIKISVGENETRYLYDTNQSLPKVIKRTQNGISTIYVYGKELISEKTDDETSYYHFDYRGSTVALTDKNGKITDKYQYDVYGNSRHTEGESGTPFRYNGSAGVMTDANNLLYMKSRYYDPEILRFISADILTGDIRNTQSLNRYVYCEGNPVSFTDPFGLSREIKLQKQEQIEAAKREQISDKIHGTLDVVGMAPAGIGMAADGLNGVIYIFEGDLVGASFSATAFIPVIGALSTPSKYGGKLALATASSGADNVFRMAGKRGDDAAELILNATNKTFNIQIELKDYIEKYEFSELDKIYSNIQDVRNGTKKIKYQNRIFTRMSEDKGAYHNIPTCLDELIVLDEPYVIRSDGRVEFLKKGTIITGENAKKTEGIYHMTMRDNEVIHRVFIPQNDWGRFSKKYNLPDFELID